MTNQRPEEYKKMISSFITDMEKKFPALNPEVPSIDEQKWESGQQHFKLKEQAPLTEADVRQAIVYAKKEIVETRNSMKKFMQELSSLPTYQFIKPQVDNLISSVDDLEALLLNRFNEKQVRERSKQEWEALQKLRTFFIARLLEKYRK